MKIKIVYGKRPCPVYVTGAFFFIYPVPLIILQTAKVISDYFDTTSVINLKW